MRNLSGKIQTRKHTFCVVRLPAGLFSVYSSISPSPMAKRNRTTHLLIICGEGGRGEVRELSENDDEGGSDRWSAPRRSAVRILSGSKLRPLSWPPLVSSVRTAFLNPARRRDRDGHASPPSPRVYPPPNPPPSPAMIIPTKKNLATDPTPIDRKPVAGRNYIRHIADQVVAAWSKSLLGTWSSPSSRWLLLDGKKAEKYALYGFLPRPAAQVPPSSLHYWTQPGISLHPTAMTRSNSPRHARARRLREDEEDLQRPICLDSLAQPSKPTTAAPTAGGSSSPGIQRPVLDGFQSSPYAGLNEESGGSINVAS